MSGSLRYRRKKSMQNMRSEKRYALKTTRTRLHDTPAGPHNRQRDQKLRFIILTQIINWRTYCEWWSVSSGQVLKNDVTICDWDISWGNETSAYKIIIIYSILGTGMGIWWYGNEDLTLKSIHNKYISNTCKSSWWLLQLLLVIEHV